MAMPTNVPIIDTMIGFPSTDRREVYKFLAPHLRDKESAEDFKMPAQYMFKDIPADLDESVDPVAVTLDNMDRFGVAHGLINVGTTVREDPPAGHPGAPRPLRRSRSTSTRNEGMDAVRKIREFHDEYGIDAVSSFPSGCMTPINDKRYYPIYAKCVELDLPIFSDRGRARAAGAARAAEGRAPRRGVLVLPGADRRHAPRRRPVDRAGREADAQVAEPLLLDLGLRPEALPRADHRRTPTHAAPTRSSTPATSPRGSPTSAS